MRAFLFSVALIAGVGCVGDGTGLDENGNPIGQAPPPCLVDPAPCSEFQQVQAVFSTNCALSGCHAGAQPQQGMNLGEGQFYTNTVNVPSNELPTMLRIMPSFPDSSYLVHKIQGTHITVGGSGAQMPFGRTPLPQERIDLIRSWITSGAPNN